MGPELSLEESLLRLGLVGLLAGAIGVERELRDHDAGLRTHILVGVGAALFVMAGNFAWTELPFGNENGIVLDPSRVVAYVVTGIGFLGAGAIIKNGPSVRGLTTAASLWVVAAIGVVVGAGDYALGVIATGAVILSLWPLRKLAAVLGLRSRQTRRVFVELEPDARIADVINALEAAGAEVLNASMVDDRETRKVTVSVAGTQAMLIEAMDGASRSASVRTVSLET